MCVVVAAAVLFVPLSLFILFAVFPYTLIYNYFETNILIIPGLESVERYARNQFSSRFNAVLISMVFLGL